MRWMAMTWAAAAASVCAAPASAGDMAVGELLGASSQADCMERARLAARMYRDRFGASGVVEDSWTVYVFNADYAGFDLVVMCAVVEGEPASFVVVHGPEGSGPLSVLAKMQQVWN